METVEYGVQIVERSSTTQSQENIVKKCDIESFYIGIDIRPETKRNIIKNCHLYRKMPATYGEYGIAVNSDYSGDDYNIIEGCTIDRYKKGVWLHASQPCNSIIKITDTEMKNATEYGLLCDIGVIMGESFGSSAVVENSEFFQCNTGVCGDGRTADDASVNIDLTSCEFINCVTADIWEYDYNPAVDNVTINVLSIPIAPEWEVGETYEIGDKVTYEGDVYICIIAHTAYAPNWTPPNTPALWTLE